MRTQTWYPLIFRFYLLNDCNYIIKIYILTLNRSYLSTVGNIILDFYIFYKLQYYYCTCSNVKQFYDSSKSVDLGDLRLIFPATWFITDPILYKKNCPSVLQKILEKRADYFYLLFVQLSLMSNKDKYRWQQGGNKI